MKIKAKQGFRRRPSTDGALISFCTRCYMIVAQGRDYTQLESAEREHYCDPRTLQHWEAMLQASKAKNAPKSA
jgi:hypothetical protein